MPVAVPVKEGKLIKCGMWAVVSECLSGLHRIMKILYCGKEWCAVCGEKYSAMHQRKIARILPKVMQMGQMGYFVIEFPKWFRQIGRAGVNPDGAGEYWCYSKRDIIAVTKIVVVILAGKRTNKVRRVGGYFKRGLLRWHWFGDKNVGVYNPHMNIMVDSGFLEKELINEIRDKLRVALNVPELIVNYSYCDKPGQMFKKVAYITRSTFRQYEWDEYMANELYNFRNQRWWGKWNDEKVWDTNKSIDDIIGYMMVVDIQKGICPVCGEKLKVIKTSRCTGKSVRWSRPISSAWADIWKAKEIAGTGYFVETHAKNEFPMYDISAAQIKSAPLTSRIKRIMGSYIMSMVNCKDN